MPALYEHFVNKHGYYSYEEGLRFDATPGLCEKTYPYY